MSLLTAYLLPGGWGLVSVSPFCLKLDSFLLMTGIEHTSVTTTTPLGAPLGKAPWIEHEGRKIGDSSFIIAYLIERFGKDPDAALSPAQRGQAVAIQRLVEENLYWSVVYDRWIRDGNWPIFKRSVLGGISAPILAVIGPIARCRMGKQLNGHGLGLHPEAEIEQIAQRDIDALAGMLGDQLWYFGEQPTLTDAVVFSVLSNIHYPEFASPMKAMIARHSNLVSHIERFRSRFYPASATD